MKAAERAKIDIRRRLVAKTNISAVSETYIDGGGCGNYVNIGGDPQKI